MLKKKHVVLSSLAIVSILLGSLFYYNMVRAQEIWEYDPWADINDDGKIDIYDVAYVARKFGTYGTPTNKTASLLELQDRVDRLNASLLDFEVEQAYQKTRIDALEASLIELHSAIDGLNASLLSLEAYLTTEIHELNTSVAELQSKVHTLETRIPKKGYVSVPAGAFTPRDNTKSYLKDYNGLRGNYRFYAPVQFPHGATLTNMTVYLRDTVEDGQIQVWLQGYNLTSMDYLALMAWVESGYSWPPDDYMALSDSTIEDARIDNRNCIYCLMVSFSYDTYSLMLFGVLIEYEYPA